MAGRQVYLDHQSSTPVLPEVLEAMRPYFTERFGNPSSLHQHGLRTREAMVKARNQFAALVNAESPDDIIFTSGGTEAINLAVKGVAWAHQRHGNHLVYSAVEHPAVVRSIEFLEKHGFAAARVKVNQDGWVDPADVRAALTEKTILICVQCANHDIGTIQSLREIGTLASERGIPLFVDGVSSAGWLPIDVQALGISLLAFAPHRFYGPKGLGILYRQRRTRLVSLLHGGVQEGGWRAGTENVPAIVGGGLAAEIAGREMPDRIAHTARLQRRFWDKLRSAVPYVCLNGPEPGSRRTTTNLNVSTEFVEGEAQMLRLDLLGVSVSSGSSCLGKALKISPVLAAIGLDHSLAQSSILITLGKDNTEEEIDFAVETFSVVASKLRALSPQWDEFERGLIDSVIHPRGGVQPSSETPASISATRNP